MLLTVTCLGQFMVLLDNTIVGAALPDMQHRLHTQLTGLQWIVDAYVLLVAMLLMSGGIFADRFGRKRVYLSGVVVFTVASVLCSLAPSVGWLVMRPGAARHRGRGSEPCLTGPARRRLSRAAGTGQSNRAVGRIQRNRSGRRPRGRMAC